MRPAASRLGLAMAAVTAIAACQAPEADAPMAEAPAHPLDAYAASAAQHDEVVGTLQQLFDALETGDEALLPRDPAQVSSSRPATYEEAALARLSVLQSTR